MNSSTDQRSTIRELATRVAQIAASEQNQKAKQRWRDVNACGRGPSARTPGRARELLSCLVVSPSS